jgi:hypothetical protein
MGSLEDGGGLSLEMRRLRTPDHDRAPRCGKKYRQNFFHISPLIRFRCVGFMPI